MGMESHLLNLICRWVYFNMGGSELQDPINAVGLIEDLRRETFGGSAFEEIPFGIG